MGSQVDHHRRRVWRYIVAVALLVGASGNARATHYDNDPATGSFGPQLGVSADTPIADVVSGLTLRITQRDHEVVTRSYRISIPVGWRFATASVDASPLATCRAVNASNIAENMEALGTARIVLQTNATRDPNPRPNLAGGPLLPAPGRATYIGAVWFLGWDVAASTATLCGYVTTSNARIARADREIMFQVDLKLLADKSWEVSFDLAAVPGAPDGERSVTDDPAFQREDASILEVMLKMEGSTYGNFNTDPEGNKARVEFSRAPTTPGSYAFVGTFAPCALDDPTRCKSNASPVISDDVVQITTYPSGYHPVPPLSEPVRFSVIRGTSSPAIRWAQPLAAPSDPIRGYVFAIQPTNRPQTRHIRYLVTDPADPAYLASADPCAPDGAAPTCRLQLDFPLATVGGGLLPANDQYTITLVTLFRDGHRSDGRCDDGTAQGAAPPCPDGSTPAFVAPGISSTDLLLRSRAWPLAYRQCIYGSRGIHQVHVLLADLEEHAFEFTSWLPLGVVKQGGGPGVAGTNGGGGVVSFLDFSYSVRFGIQAVLSPRSAVGIVERLNANIPTPIGGLPSPSETILFSGQIPSGAC